MRPPFAEITIRPPWWTRPACVIVKGLVRVLPQRAALALVDRLIRLIARRMSHRTRLVR